MHLNAAGARSRTEAYDSLCLRLPELKHALLTDAAFFNRFVEALQLARTPRKIMKTLGLSEHPSCKLAVRAWDPMFRKIVYHSDPWSLYHSRPDVVCVQNGPPPPAPLADAGRDGQDGQDVPAAAGDVVMDAAADVQPPGATQLWVQLLSDLQKSLSPLLTWNPSAQICFERPRCCCWKSSLRATWKAYVCIPLQLMAAASRLSATSSAFAVRLVRLGLTGNLERLRNCSPRHVASEGSYSFRWCRRRQRSTSGA